MVYTSLLAEYPKCYAAKVELRRTEDRLREQDHGLFGSLAMHKAAAEKTLPYFDIATYERPVEIRLTETRRHGLFTMKDVATGDLLLCEKACSYSFLGNPTPRSLMNGNAVTEFLINPHDKSGASKPFAQFHPDVSPSRDS